MSHDVPLADSPLDRVVALPPLAPVARRVTALNDRYRHHGATAVLERALHDADVGRIALVSSFGAESVVLLHMVSVMRPETPVLFLETEMLFPETLAYQRELTERLGLTDVRLIHPDPEDRRARDPDNTLHQRDMDACCLLRKAEPLERALRGFDTWITGRKRFQGGTRTALEFFENEAEARIKVNPLARWAKEDVQEYMLNNRLPRHPLVAQGYPSIGCAPCTSPVAEGEDERAGRWRGTQKDECGIHFVNGKMVRGPMPADAMPLDTMPLVAAAPLGTSAVLPMPEQAMDGQPAALIPGLPVLVTDSGFANDDWTHPVTPLADLPARFAAVTAIDLGPADDPVALTGHLAEIDLIRVAFPSFSDGRGFTLARQLRLMGYHGRLRAAGPMIADQYAMARRSGFDEVEIPASLAERQPWEQWQARANWRAHDYQARLRA